MKNCFPKVCIFFNEISESNGIVSFAIGITMSKLNLYVKSALLA